MKLYENNETIKVFRCPQCNEYIASDSTQCRFCSSLIEAETLNLAVAQENYRNKLYRKNDYSKHLKRGFGLLALGVSIMTGSYFLSEALLRTDFVWIPRALILGGGGDFLYGVYGLISETRAK